VVAAVPPCQTIGRRPPGNSGPRPRANRLVVVRTLRCRFGRGGPPPCCGPAPGSYSDARKAIGNHQQGLHTPSSVNNRCPVAHHRKKQARCLHKHPRDHRGRLIGVSRHLWNIVFRLTKAASRITPTRQQDLESASSKPDQRTGRRSSVSRSFQFQSNKRLVPCPKFGQLCYPRSRGMLDAGPPSDGPTRSLAFSQAKLRAARTSPRVPRSFAVPSHKAGHGPSRIAMTWRRSYKP